MKSYFTMHWSYLKFIFRHLFHDRTYFFTATLSLSIGLASFVLIYIFIQDELSFDRFHKNGDRIFRIVKNHENALLGPPVAGHIAAKDYPEIESIIRFTRADGGDISFGEKRFSSTSLYFVDPQAFSAFSFEVTAGQDQNPLEQPNTIVLTEPCAAKYFGEENAIGKTIHYQNQYPLTVTALIRDVSSKTHLPFDALINHSIQDKHWGENVLSDHNSWFWSTSACYVLLNPKADHKVLEGKIKETFGEKINEDRAHEVKLGLQELGKVYLHSKNMAGFHETGDIGYIYIFSGLAILILLIGIINFVNLATARSINRAREVGIRKSVGANRLQLMRQFIMEAYFVVFISTIVAYFLVQTFLPNYNLLIDRSISHGLTQSIRDLGLLLLVVGLIAGSYPAFVLSSFNPIKALKGKIIQHVAGLNIRRTLVIVQFMIGILVMTMAILIYQQMEFISQKNLGLDKDQIVIIDFPQISPIKFETFRNELLNNSGIQGVGGSWIPPFHTPGIKGPAFAEINRELIEIASNPQFVWIDKDFIPTYNINFIAGKNFVLNPNSANREFILNESAVELAGWKEPSEAIGKKFQYRDGTKGTIVGVVADFHFEKLQNPIKPMVLFQEPKRINVMSIKIGDQNVKGTMAFIHDRLKHHFQNETYPVYFLGENYDASYKSVEDMRTIFVIFSALGILTGCLGLFALCSHVMSGKRKEIGIRKVLGAQISRLLLGLNLPFALMVLMALIAVSPFTYMIMNSWMQEFAYHIDISIGPFLLAGSIAIFCALFTVSFATTRTALANPIEALRTE